MGTSFISDLGSPRILAHTYDNPQWLPVWTDYRLASGATPEKCGPYEFFEDVARLALASLGYRNVEISPGVPSSLITVVADGHFMGEYLVCDVPILGKLSVLDQGFRLEESATTRPQFRAALEAIIKGAEAPNFALLTQVPTP